MLSLAEKKQKTVSSKQTNENRALQPPVTQQRNETQAIENQVVRTNKKSRASVRNYE